MLDVVITQRKAPKEHKHVPFKEGKMCLANALLALLRELAAARAQFCTLHTLWRLVLVLSHGGLFPPSTVLLDTQSPSSFIPPSLPFYH